MSMNKEKCFEEQNGCAAAVSDHLENVSVWKWTRCVCARLAHASERPEKSTIQNKCGRTFLFWIRDEFCTQHLRCWDQNTSQIQILRHFEKKKGRGVNF